MDAIMTVQATERARARRGCEHAKAAGNPEMPPLWPRSLTSREESALSALEGGTESDEDLAVVAALCEECWHGGCACEEEAFLMHAASAAELGCPGFCGLPGASWKEAV